MEEVTYTKMSSKGQVVIPQMIRESLGIEEGQLFAVFGKDDTIVLMRVTPPSKEEIEEIFKWGREFAKEKGITREDVERAIAEVRQGNLEPL